MQGLVFLIPIVGIIAACLALGVNRASYYRAQKPKPPMKPRPRPTRALDEDERAHVIAVLDSDAFMDKAPAQVYAKLGIRSRSELALRLGTEDTLPP